MIPAATVVGMIASRMPPAEVVEELPPPEPEDLSAALHVAAHTVTDHQLPLEPTA